MELQTTSNGLDALSVDGIVVGIFEDSISEALAKFAAKDYLTAFRDIDGFDAKTGESLLLFKVADVAAPRIALMGMGKQAELTAETVRKTAGAGAKLLRDNGAKSLAISAMGNAQAVAEGVLLALYRFDYLMTMNPEKRPTVDKIYFSGSADEIVAWEKGVKIAHAQNLARKLGEMPSNIATPTYFTEQAKEYLDNLRNVKINVYDEKWAAKQKMGAFLAVAKGTHEPAKFLVIEYTGGNPEDKPFAVIGKGITFDSGGISLKPSNGMGAMRGDCSGAAAAIGALYGIATLELPVNAVAVTPLTENMPGGDAIKPADVVFASNGKSIEVDNTDAEGRMILADALVYTEKTFQPHTVVDLATLTGAMMVALGEHYVGTFTRSDELFEQLDAAGKTTEERFWRMPLDDKYKNQIKSSLADVKNVGGRPAGSITAALFLSEFITLERWAHLDIAGAAWTSKASEYKPKGNIGVPVRALIQLAANFE